MSQGIQDNNIQKIDLVYTKLGRFLKSINSPDSQITKFALSDDGIDYSLYDDNLPEDEKDLRIRRTAQFDAWTDDDAIMKNKLITLQRDTTEQTKLKVSPSAGEFVINPASSSDRQVTTFTVNAGYATPNGFNVRLSDSRYITLSELIVDPDTDPIEFPTELYPTLSTDFLTRSLRTRGDSRDVDDGSRTPRRSGSRDREEEREPRPPIFRDGGNGNKEPQTIRVSGSNSAPTVTEFKVYYNERSWRKFDLDTEYKTKISVESLDSGEVIDVEFTLTPA